MAAGWDVLAFFLANPDKSFCVSDIMRCVGVSWVTANDAMFHMVKLGMLRKSGRGYVLVSFFKKEI